MSKETAAPTKVFISYSWDSDEHKEHVLMLANTLRDPWGIETDIDQYVRARHPFTPTQGWDLWMEKRVEWAEFVLIVCTEVYKKRFRGDEEPGIGKGVTWEGTIIRQHLYNDQLTNTKFIPVVFSRQDLPYIPLILNSHDKYVLDNEKSFRELAYRLRKEPIVSIPEVTTAKLQAPPEPKFLSQKKTPAEPPPVFLNTYKIRALSAAQEAAQQAERERILGEQLQRGAKQHREDPKIRIDPTLFSHKTPTGNSADFNEDPRIKVDPSIFSKNRTFASGVSNTKVNFPNINSEMTPNLQEYARKSSPSRTKSSGEGWVNIFLLISGIIFLLSLCSQKPSAPPKTPNTGNSPPGNQSLNSKSNAINPGETAIVEPKLSRFKVIRESANLRKTPSLSGEDIGDLNPGDRVIPGELSRDGRWLEVTTQDGKKTGWVWAEFVQ